MTAGQTLVDNDGVEVALFPLEYINLIIIFRILHI